MFVSDSAIASRLDNPNNLARRNNNDLLERKFERATLPPLVVLDENGNEITNPDSCAIVPSSNGGRRLGDKNLPDSMRSIIGACARIDTLKNTAKAFDVSAHHAFELKHGIVDGTKGENEELKEAINKELEQPHELAVSKLTATLLALTPEKINGVSKAKELGTLAANLSRVAENTAPLKHKEGEGLGDCKLIVYSPVFNQENHYGTVKANQGD